MSSFFRYPHTPHLAWLGATPPRDDKVLSSAEAGALLAGSVAVEEKLDGANLGISLRDDGQLQFQNRGQYLRSPYTRQFARLNAWTGQHGHAVRSFLKPSQILFGEWLAARHTVLYGNLPDWFVAFDVYDQMVGRFWCTTRRNAFAERLGLPVAPSLFHGQTSLTALTALVTESTSRFGAVALEGLIVRRDDEQFNLLRAKLVRPSFVQGIDGHWRHRQVEWNRVGST
ncbi:MAG: RNA ligase family protein [Acetobacteraceae bacterium]